VERLVSALGRTERIVIGLVAVFTVLAGIGHYAGWGSIVAFVFATIALAGLAHVVSVGVEGVGELLGPGIAGFMQASLGNLPELFLVIFALREGEAVVAQSTVIGSIFSNALLVLGIVIVVGSRKAPGGVMRFRHRLPNDTATLLIATTFIIVIVGLSLQTHDPASSHVNTVSTIAAIGLLIVYLFWVVPYIRSGEEPGDEGVPGGETTHRADMITTDRGGAIVARAEPHTSALAGAEGGVAVAEAQRVMTGAGAADDEDGEAIHRHMPLKVGILLLTFGGVGAAFVSDWFVSALAPTVDQLGISRAFAGLVIAAIAGNAVENITAVILASKGQANLAVSVVKNSVGQMAAFMWPALVLISLPMAHKLTFSLSPVYIGALLVTALAMWQITGDGEAVAFEGLALIAIYLTLAGITLYETV
jgi:Ca2+:H+ antiporter